jgi:hypothetical protein
MIIHGTEDSTIPIEHGAALHDEIHPRYQAEPFWVIGKGHNDMDYNFDPLIDRLTEFIEFYCGDLVDKAKAKISVKSGKSSSNHKPHSVNVTVR